MFFFPQFMLYLGIVVGERISMNFFKLNNLWTDVLLSLKNKLQDNNIFNTFFQDSKLYEVKEDTAYISVKTKFAKELLESRYLDLIEITLEEIANTSFHCIITMEKERENLIFVENDNIENQLAKTTSNLNKNYTFENFVVGPSNRECYTAAVAAAYNPGASFNPLFIYGKSGLGKTHLLHAIGNHIRTRSAGNLRVLYLTTDDFIRDFVNSTKTNEVET